MDVLAFGEVLWDVFPGGQVIGGAPFNFSAHFAKLGGKAGLVTALGRDALGDRTLSCIKNSGVSAEFVCASDRPTGTCLVTVDQSGHPSYELSQDTAYDHIALDEKQWDALRASSAPAFYFGTLAQRSEKSRETLSRILADCRFEHILYDVNIRQSLYSREIVRQGLSACTMLKASREEAWVFLDLGLTAVEREAFGSPRDYYTALCRALARDYRIATVLLTLDKDGAMVYSAKEDAVLFSQKSAGEVVSTVGAGDSFSACYLYWLLKGAPPAQCLSRAVLLSSFVVRHVEAVPDYTNELKAALSISP